MPRLYVEYPGDGQSIHMNRTSRRIVLVFAGLALGLALVLSMTDARLALGAAGIGGVCAAWVAGIAYSGRVASRSRGDVVSDCPILEAEMPAAEASAPDGRSVVEVTLPQTTEVEDVLEALLASARIAGSPVAAHLWLEDVGTPTLRLVHAVGSIQPEPTPVPSSEGILGAALANGDASCGLVRVGPQSGDASLWRYAFPLSTDEASGLGVVDFDAEPDGASCTRVASALRGSLIGALALHVARSESGSARQLLDAARELSGADDPDEVVRIALAHALRLSQAETGSVMLLTADSAMHIVESHGLPEEVVENTRVPKGEGIAGWVLSSGRPLVVEDLDHKGPQSSRHGVLSAASVPISDDDGVLGVLNVGSRTFHARFSRTHVRALEAIGRMTATALRHARNVSLSRDVFFDTLRALALSLESRDPYSRGGTARIMAVAIAIAEKIALGPEQTRWLRLAVLLHDIGMSAAGESVAVSNRPLTTVEWAMLKMHPRVAAEILSEAPALAEVIPLVIHHHEHYDGTGYGEGLAGDRIPLGARILSVADAYVAMTTSRPYRRAMTRNAAIDELTSHAGTQFDPRIVEVLAAMAEGGAECLALPA